VTAVAQGRRCLPVASLAAARQRARGLRRPLLAGELGGVTPRGFALTNSPAAIAARDDVERPLVLLSSSGTRLIDGVRTAGAVYPACLRNVRALAAHLSQEPAEVTLLGAATRGEFREEDQLCCARLALRLVAAGFTIADHATEAVMRRWGDAGAEQILGGASAGFLRRTGQLDDLLFIVRHIDDLDGVFRLRRREIVREEGSCD
jgi:2-phosphosulfolactate phosphatase